MKLTIWHNIMWSRYKAVVWSRLNEIMTQNSDTLHVFQVAETDSDRVSLSPVDRELHQYPYTLLFDGSYSQVSTLKMAIRMARLSWRDDADFVILTGYHRFAHWMQMLTLKLRGQRFGLFCDSTLYDQPQTRLKSVVKRFLFARAELIFCYGDRAKAYLEYHGVTADRIRFRNQTPALPDGYSAAAALERRLSLRANTSEQRFLYVGRLSPEKSIDRLIAAFAIVCEENENAKLVIVGGGPEEGALKRQAEALGLGDAVDFAGSKHGQDLFDEFARASCFVLPSHSEPWGLVVNEALSYGCPVVVSHRCGCVPELVIEGETGFAYDWDDQVGLANAMINAAALPVDQTAHRTIELANQFTPETAATAIYDAVTDHLKV